jgi:acetoacetate decarboxylase
LILSDSIAGIGNVQKTTEALSKTQINLKLIPSVDGRPEICQLVGH